MPLLQIEGKQSPSLKPHMWIWFRPAEGTGLASSHGGELKLLYLTAEGFSLQRPLGQNNRPQLVAMETGWDPGTVHQNGMSKDMAEHPVRNRETKVPPAHAEPGMGVALLRKSNCNPTWKQPPKEGSQRALWPWNHKTTAMGFSSSDKNEQSGHN